MILSIRRHLRPSLAVASALLLLVIAGCRDMAGTPSSEGGAITGTAGTDVSGDPTPTGTSTVGGTTGGGLGDVDSGGDF